MLSGIDGESGRRQRDASEIYPTAVGEPQNTLPLPLLQQDFILKMIPIPQKSRGGIPLLLGNPAPAGESRSCGESRRTLPLPLPCNTLRQTVPGLWSGYSRCRVSKLRSRPANCRFAMSGRPSPAISTDMFTQLSFISRCQSMNHFVHCQTQLKRICCGTGNQCKRS